MKMKVNPSYFGSADATAVSSYKVAGFEGVRKQNNLSVLFIVLIHVITLSSCVGWGDIEFRDSEYELDEIYGRYRAKQAWIVGNPKTKIGYDSLVLRKDWTYLHFGLTGDSVSFSYEGKWKPMRFRVEDSIKYNEVWFSSFRVMRKEFRFGVSNREGGVTGCSTFNTKNEIGMVFNGDTGYEYSREK